MIPGRSKTRKTAILSEGKFRMRKLLSVKTRVILIVVLTIAVMATVYLLKH